LESGQKLVIFAHHREAQRMLMEAFADLNPAHVFGDDSSSTRQEQVDRFQNDPSCQLMVASLKAAGVGITLTAASHAAFCELPWTYADLAQAEDRIHRIGQDESLDSVNYYRLLAEDVKGLGHNIDDYMMAIINRKQHIADAATGKSAVIALAEKLLEMQFEIEEEMYQRMEDEDARRYEEMAHGR
jgi:SWI/SNF-related matrix-associated actin-dependent regulator 1 of chromatin subfamily A